MSARYTTLMVEAKNLVSKDRFSASDPFVVVWIRNRSDRDSKWIEIGRTETLQNQANPRFRTPLHFLYEFHAVQELKVVLYDSDSTASDLSKHDLIKEMQLDVSTLLQSDQGAQTMKWDKSSLTLTFEQATWNKDTLSMQVSCEKLPKMDGMFGKADPYFTVSHLAENGSWINSYTSPVQKKTLNPEWSIDEELARLCNGDTKAEVKIEVWDWDADGKHDFIGFCLASFGDLVQNRTTTMELSHPKKKKRGSITFAQVTQTRMKTFMDRLKEGLQLEVSAFVDFTGSNGHPLDVGSLHYIKGAENQYQEALRRLVPPIVQYDADQKVPLFGFGGIPPNTTETSHCFPLTLPETVLTDPIECALKTYEHAIGEVTFSGPTYFQDILRHLVETIANAHSVSFDHRTIFGDLVNATVKVIRASKTVPNYQVGVILTDGAIHDMKKVKEQLVEASRLPLSIIIVGVGSAADLVKMKELDSDGQLLQDHRGYKAQRDMVNYVSLMELRFKGEATLAKATLEELPDQVVEYFKGNSN